MFFFRADPAKVGFFVSIHSGFPPCLSALPLSRILVGKSELPNLPADNKRRLRAGQRGAPFCAPESTWPSTSATALRHPFPVCIRLTSSLVQSSFCGFDVPRESKNGVDYFCQHRPLKMIC